MDHFTVSIQRKMSKIENSLSELNNEIFTSIQYLMRLKENSSKIVRNLNSITVLPNYLSNFMDVNSFILKYLSFLNEINCKFEMLEMSENAFASTISISKAINLEVMPGSVDKLKSEINNKSIFDSKFNISNAHSKKIIIEQPSESEASLSTKSSKGKKLKKKKSKNCQKSEFGNNKIKRIIEYETKAQKATKKLGNDSDTKLNETNFYEKDISADVSYDLPGALCLNNIEEKEISYLNKTISSSETSVCCKKNSIDIKEIIQSTPGNEPGSTSFDSFYNFASDKDLLNKVQSPVKDIPVVNVETKRIIERRFSSQVSVDYNYIQSPKCKTQDVTRCNRLRENADEMDEIKPAMIVRKPGEEYDVAIEHIKSPSEFYVSFTDFQSNFLELEKRLKSIPGHESQIIKETENRKVHLSKEIGAYALFYSKCDEMWCRAKVTNWCLNFIDDFVNIFLIDYGEYKCVSMNDLKPMPECFKQYNAFTQRCHLYGLIPLEMDIDDDGETLFWEKESTEKMKSLTENSQMIKIKIALDDGFYPFISLPVTLWLVDQDNQCVNELLVKSKHAIQKSTSDSLKTETVSNENLSNAISNNKNCTVENENLNDWNPMKEDFESYHNSYDLDINDPAAFIYGYVGKDYERICPHFAKTGHCFKGQACKKEHQKLDPLGFTTDQEEIYKNAFNILSVPHPESVLIVQVTCVLSINQFYCLPENDRLLNSDEEDLQSLLKFINKTENIQEMKKLLIPPSTGQIVIARYSEDKFWYRGRILESEPEKDAYKVMFVDYGNKETLQLSEIRAIEAKYLHLPFQAIHCSIFGIDRNPEAHVEDIMDYLNKKLYDDHISIKIVTRLPGDDVNLLVHVFDHNGKDIGEELIAKNYAIFKEEMVISNQSLSVPG